MMGAVAAAVNVRDWTAKDRLGNHVERYADPVEVAVLVAPGGTNDLSETRPEGVRVDLTLHFPKSWTDAPSLRGAKVELPWPYEGTYKVVGVPEPYMPDMVPFTFGDFWLPVEVERYDG